MEAACSATKDEKMEDSTCSGADKDASLSAIAAAVFLGSSPAVLTVAGSEVAGCSGCIWGDIGLNFILCIMVAVCSGGVIMSGLELDPAPLVTRAPPCRCFSCTARSTSIRATCN
uniref:Uncharacterized protein n=1 Tax=Arundo donax TaxID=35708 RepID=A0A0A9D4Q7_ARUDO